MAYMSQENKKELSVGIKAVLKKHKMKGSIKVEHHSKLVVTLSSGVIDFGVNQRTVNHYHFESAFEGNNKAIEFLTELKAAMNVGNFDKSDVMSDYFHVGWYIGIDIGSWKKPYEVVEG